MKHIILELVLVILKNVLENDLTKARLCETENGSYLKNINFTKLM